MFVLDLVGINSLKNGEKEKKMVEGERGFTRPVLIPEVIEVHPAPSAIAPAKARVLFSVATTTPFAQRVLASRNRTKHPVGDVSTWTDLDCKWAPNNMRAVSAAICQIHHQCIWWQHPGSLPARPVYP